MFGHMNNVSTFTYFEVARIEFLKSIGLFGNDGIDVGDLADLHLDGSGGEAVGDRPDEGFPVERGQQMALSVAGAGDRSAGGQDDETGGCGIGVGHAHHSTEVPSGVESSGVPNKPETPPKDPGTGRSPGTGPVEE